MTPSIEAYRSRPTRGPVGTAFLIIVTAVLAMTGVFAFREPQPAAAAGPSRASETPFYYVWLADPALAMYPGAERAYRDGTPAVYPDGKLNPEGPNSLAYVATLEAAQAELQAAIGSALGVTFADYLVGKSAPTDRLIIHYYHAINAMAIEMSFDEAHVVARLPGVVRVTPDFVRYVETDAGPEWIEAGGVWGATDPNTLAFDAAPGGLPNSCAELGPGKSCGEGIVVGIIDTGINAGHPSFATTGGDGYVHDNPRPRFYGNPYNCDPITGLPRCNQKLIGIWDFAEPPAGIGEDVNGHGSHTASTAAGNVVKNAVLEAPNIDVTATISGVAPHANIISYKVCVVIGSCVGASLTLGINQAVADAVDVTNYSIGGGSADPWTDADAVAFRGANAAGIFTAASAGNSGPGAATIGSPSDAPWVTSVGASTHNRMFAGSLLRLTRTGGTGSATIGPFNGKSLTCSHPDTNTDCLLDATGTAPIVYGGTFPANNPAAIAAFAGTGNTSRYCGYGPADPTGYAPNSPWLPGTFTNQIVVCERGLYGRVQMAQNVAQAGADGYVLLNNAPNGNSLIADPYPIPGVHLSYADGVILKDWLASGSAHMAAIQGTTPTPTLDPAVGDIMAGFSSRGQTPSVPDILKPDVTAPGVDIWAAFHMTHRTSNPDYNVISGTSMSSPHAAGAGALLAGAHPTWTEDQIRSALMTTGVFATVRKEDATTPADPFDMGGGRIRLSTAVNAGLLFNESPENYLAANPNASTPGDPRRLNIASLADNDCPVSCTWRRTVTATANGTGTWTASYSGPAGMVISASPSSFSATATNSYTFDVTVNTAALEAGRWYFGAVTYTKSPLGTTPPMRIPIAVFVTPPPLAPPVLDDPGETDADGDFGLTWSNITGEVGYRVQQSTNFATLVADNAEGTLTTLWTRSTTGTGTGTASGGWTQSTARANSPTRSYYSGQAFPAGEYTSTLTLTNPVAVPTGAEATLSFASWEDTEPGFDYGYVQVSNNGGTSWTTILTINGDSRGWVNRSAVLPITGNVQVRFLYDADLLVGIEEHEGWYVDDITLSAGNWTTIGNTATDVVNLQVLDRANGTYYYRVAGMITPAAGLFRLGPWSNVEDIVVQGAAQQPVTTTPPPTGAAPATRAPSPTPARFLPNAAGDWTATPEALTIVTSGLILLGSLAALSAPRVAAWRRSRR